ncbi:kinase-like domain-containing protein [Rhizophagus clarus]|uniref:Kinase-like domain-containing protein n=1 Tax=Rhizophagus clarus TaxID=94130 RepID=A0A8H3QHY9_9GLOM|nr:kinase-like domain-containing protein [Rhizophagus clarus]
MVKYIGSGGFILTSIRDSTSNYMLVMKYYEMETYALIGDVGLYGPCNLHENDNSGQIYSVLPYIAPEVLRGKSHSAASDMYLLGIIMNILATGKSPWYNRAHDISLAKDICDGERLEIPEDTPSFYARLMRQCWNNEPEKHPLVTDLYK